MYQQENDSTTEFDAYLYYRVLVHAHSSLARKVNHNLNFAIVLCTKSTIHVLSNGAYWDVTSLIASWAARPPRRAAVVGKVEKPPRTLMVS